MFVQNNEINVTKPAFVAVKPPQANLMIPDPLHVVDSILTLMSVITGHGPRLSKVNLFTLLSLWMELFPWEQREEDDHSQVGAQTHREIDHLE